MLQVATLICRFCGIYCVKPRVPDFDSILLCLLHPLVSCAFAECLYTSLAARCITTTTLRNEPAERGAFAEVKPNVSAKGARQRV